MRPLHTASYLLKYARIALIVSASTLAQAQFEQQPEYVRERLHKIATKEESLYDQIAADPDHFSPDDVERHVRELTHAYQNFLTDYPNHLEANILYGKLLRRIGRPNEAFNTFLRADEINPKVAVVKQQIGNHLAETGKGKAALTFYLQAVDLEPNTPIYQFGLGELLLNYGNQFIEESIYTRETLDREIMRVFKTAAALAPDNLNYQMRVGETYYDQMNPDWSEALKHWDQLKNDALTGTQNEIIDLHRAYALSKLGRYTEARETASKIQSTALQASKNKVLQSIAQF